VQITLQLTIDAQGKVESSQEMARVPSDAPDAFVTAAQAGARRVTFLPTSRDGRYVRSRVRYVVFFHPPAKSARPVADAEQPPASAAASTNEADEDYVKEVQVRGARRSASRGLGDVRIKRELLDAAPHAQAGELLSAAPGFFVDHEDGEGAANDVILRGFELDHGAGIEMKLGSVPFNIPLHIQGQGYADPSFIIPEVVRSIRVLGGPYDPRQGDAAIAGSAYFDLGVRERGYRVQATHGSFDQTRLVAIAAPRGADEETFAAVALRKSDGFGQNRASRSGSAIAQVAVEIGARDQLRLLSTAYAAQSDVAGVVRLDDVDAGRVGFYDAYPRFTAGSGVRASRFIVGVDYDHMADNGGHFELAPWVMVSDSRTRQNYAGNLESSRATPALFGLGDLFENANAERAAGATARFHTAPLRMGRHIDVVLEPGLSWRFGDGDQSKSLLVPGTLAVWDRRVDQHLRTFDAGAYFDLDASFYRVLRLSGGVRADWLRVAVDDRMEGAGAQRRAASGAVLSPRVTAELTITKAIAPVVSWGEGFRSLDATSLVAGAGHPYSKVRSFEAGVRLQALDGRYAATVTAFTTYVGNELVFDASSGGLATERASTRSGMVASVITNPLEWLLVSASLSLARATFDSQAPGRPRHVPNVPPILWRNDLAVHGLLGQLGGAAVFGRAGLAYTFLAGRHLTDAVVGRVTHALNATAALRRGPFELSVDAYNVLGLPYADDAEVYVSNWSALGDQPPASAATHITAAPPRTVLGTLAVAF